MPCRARPAAPASRPTQKGTRQSLDFFRCPWFVPDHGHVACCDKRAIVRLTPLGFRGPCPITSHEASFDTHHARRPAVAALHVGVAPSIVNNNRKQANGAGDRFPQPQVGALAHAPAWLRWLTCRCSPLVPSPLRERAQWCAHELERV